MDSEYEKLFKLNKTNNNYSNRKMRDHFKKEGITENKLTDQIRKKLKIHIEITVYHIIP